MARHTLETHGGSKGPDNGLKDYRMELLQTHKKPLTRLLMEGVLVKDHEDDPEVESLNSRAEYFQPEFIRTSYQRGAQQNLS